MALAIAGIGTALPACSYDQKEGLKVAQSLVQRTTEQTSWLPGLYEHTGIDRRYLCLGQTLMDDVIGGTRRSGSSFLPKLNGPDFGPSTQERMVAYQEHAPRLAQQSAREALLHARTPARDITHLVTVSCTGFYAPGWDVTLIRELGLSASVQRTHLGFMACHGALNGLRVARAFVDADPRVKVLLCATELCSLHYHYQWDPQKIVANAIFADGSAALVGVHDSGPAAQRWRLVDSASQVIPQTEDAMTWGIGDHGFVMTLSKSVPGIICKSLRMFIEPWLAEHNLAVQDIRSWAIHPGGPRILDAAGEALALTSRQLQPAREVFAGQGNMSSPTVLFILDHLQKLGSGVPCVALGFGPGLTVEAALFQ